jgi:SAM-dependent methyltransferase
MLSLTLRDCAPKLQFCSEGWWVSCKVSEVSYPTDGNKLCFDVEESSFWFEHRNRCIVQALKLFPPDGPVFDVGGGNGFVARAIQDSGFDVVLVEPGLSGVQNAVKRGVRQVVRSTLQDADIIPGTLPAVGLFDVLEHIRDDRDFLVTANRLTVAGGRIYLTVPAYKWLWSNEDLLAGHFRRYTVHSLSNVMRDAGYVIDFATHLFSFLPPAVLLRRVVPYRLGLRSSGLSEKAIRSDHQISHPAVRRAIEYLTRRELSAMSKGRAVRFGGSYLVVARKL